MLTPKRVADMLEEVDYPDGKYVEVYWHAEEFRELIAAWRAQHDPSIVKFKNDGATLVNLDPITLSVDAAHHRIAEPGGAMIRVDIRALDEGGTP